MFACIETNDRFENNLEMKEISDRAVELAMELAAEGVDEEEIDEFLDNCEEDWDVVEILGAIVRGEIEQEENGTFMYCGEEVAGGLGETRELAALAYVDMRLTMC